MSLLDSQPSKKQKVIKALLLVLFGISIWTNQRNAERKRQSQESIQKTFAKLAAEKRAEVDSKRLNRRPGPAWPFYDTQATRIGQPPASQNLKSN